MRGVFGGAAGAKGVGPWIAGLALFLTAGAPLAQPSQQAVTAPVPFPAGPSTGQNGAAAPRPTAAAPSGNLTKFEARRVRHACLERANDKALKGKEREEYLVRCIFGRSAMRRAVRRDCRKQGLAKNLDRAALRDFIHQCAEAYYAAQKPAE
jgi:hypothetical protein